MGEVNMSLVDFFCCKKGTSPMFASAITRKMHSSLGGGEACRQMFIDCEKYFKTPKREGYHYNYNNMIWHVRRVVFTCLDYAGNLTKEELENLKKDINYLLEDIKLFFSREIEFDATKEKDCMAFYNKLEKYLNDLYSLRASLEKKECP